MILWHFQRQSAIKAPLTLRELAAPLKLLNVIPTGKKKPKSSSQLWDSKNTGFFQVQFKIFSLPKTQFPFFCFPDTQRGFGTYLCLELAFGEGHHLLIGHLGEEGSVLVQPEALQPGWDICSTKGRRGELC